MANNISMIDSIIKESTNIYKIIPTYIKYYISSSFIRDEQDIYTTIIIILLIIGIVLLNKFANTNMLIVGTIEFWAFVSILVFIFFYTFSYLTIFSSIISSITRIQTGGDDHFAQKYMNLLFSPIIFLISLILYIVRGLLFNVYSVLEYFFSEFKSLFIPENIESLPKYGLLFSIIILVYMLLYFASFDSGALTKNASFYAFSIIIPLILIFGYINYGNSISTDPKYKLLIMGFVIAFLTTILYFYASMNTQTVTSLFYIINMLIVLIAIVGLALFFYVFSNYLKSMEGWSGFFVYFIFYIPCLLLDFVKYIRNEFDMTSNIVFILFVIEIILILAYIYLPLLINYITYSDGIVLLKNSAFLDSSQIIGSNQYYLSPDMTQYSVFNLSTTNPNSPPIYNKNYAITMWVYLNNQPANYSAYNSESNVFDYGNGKPRITYNNNDVTINGSTMNNSYTVYFTNTTKDSYEIKLPSQKWNNIVFNYSSTNVDLYINGNLERTFTFNDNNKPTYSSTDNVTIGSENGLNGAICNIRYYSSPLLSSKISNMYNLLMYKSPPTI